MAANILITGAAGYIGGSILSNIISRSSGLLKGAKIHASVRSADQVQALSALNVSAIVLDLNNEEVVTETILSNKIDVVVNATASYMPNQAKNLIKALGQQGKISKQRTFFIHTSVITMYAEEGGWPYGEVRDTDPIYVKDQEIGGNNPVRQTNNTIVEIAKEFDVASFIIAVPFTYGRGAGEFRKLSVNIPAYVRTSLQQKVVYKFDKDGYPPATHVSDLSELYALLLEKLLQNETVPEGENGYYFAMAHRVQWWAIMDLLASKMFDRGLVSSPKPKVWADDDMAAEHLGFPRPHVRAMNTTTGGQVAVNAYKLGWNPKWSEKKFMDSIDDEISDVLELDTIKPTLFSGMVGSSQ